MGDLLLKIYCDRSLRKIYSVVPKCTLFKSYCHHHHPSAQLNINKTVFFTRCTLRCLCQDELPQHYV